LVLVGAGQGEPTGWLALVTLGWRRLPLVGDGLALVVAAGQCLPLADLTATLGVTSPRWLTRRVRWNRATPGAQRWTTGGGAVPLPDAGVGAQRSEEKESLLGFSVLFCCVLCCSAGFLVVTL